MKDICIIGVGLIGGSFARDLRAQLPEATVCGIDASKEHLDELYGEYVEQGYEGQMIRLDGPYENNRSPRLLKRKEFVDEEYTILGYEEGKGNRAGTIKHFKFKNKDGKGFNSNVKGTFEYLTELLEKADELIGKEATIKYFNLTPDGVPRFPYVIAIRDYE